MTSDGMKPQVQPRYCFVDADGVAAVVLTNETLSLHTTQYVDFEHFAKQFSAVMNAWQGVRPKTFVERLGLRFWDVVQAEHGLAREDFFADPFAAMPDVWSGHQTTRSGHELIYELAEPLSHLVQTRIYFAHTGVMPLPVNLTPAPELLLAERARGIVSSGSNSTNPIAHIDIDVSADVKKHFEPDLLVSIAHKLHDSESSMFKSITSERGQAVWRGGK